MTNQFNPQRVNPGDDDHDRLMVQWTNNDKARRFDFMGIHWMQIIDVQGICFVPVKPTGGYDQYYGDTSFKGNG